jgi:ferrochelatase
MTTIGVLLLTYGSPATLADVPQYLANVRGGRPMPEEERRHLEAEFTRRYDLIGGSPLIARTREQAAALGEELRRQFPAGPAFRTGIGMRFSEPTIAQAVAAMADAGVERIVGIIMSPQYSPIIMSGYNRALDAAVAAVPAEQRPVATMAGAWHTEPLFIAALAQRVREGLDRFPPEIRGRVPVLFSAHSMPKRVTDQEPEYIEQLQETARAIASRVGLPDDQWMFCYQSAGHEPGEWLKPDFKDIMPQLARAGHREVLMAPVQFLADHLEILYDIDHGAREEAEREGITFARIESLNAMPLFIQALASIARRELEPAAGSGQQAAVGSQQSAAVAGG